MLSKHKFSLLLSQNGVIVIMANWLIRFYPKVLLSYGNKVFSQSENIIKDYSKHLLFKVKRISGRKGTLSFPPPKKAPPPLLSFLIFNPS